MWESVRVKEQSLYGLRNQEQQLGYETQCLFLFHHVSFYETDYLTKAKGVMAYSI